nr:hypothetical protein [Tanacetum cinerariifolium]
KESRKKGTDYDEVFAPVARIKAIRMFLAYVSFIGFLVYQMDVKNAFLFGRIEEEVYVCQTLGFEHPDHPDKASKEKGSSKDYIFLPLWKDGLLFDSSSNNANNDEPQPSSDAEKKNDDGVSKESGINYQERHKNDTQNVNTAGPSINIVSTNVNKEGHTQEEGTDYDEVFAPVARIKAIRMFLAYVSFMGFLVYQMDVKNAFLFGRIEEEVYVCQTLGFEHLDHPDKRKDRSDLIYQTAKRRYFACEDEFYGRTYFFLRLQVKKKEDGIFISHEKYVTEVLREFNFSDVKSANTPVDTENTLVKDAYGANCKKQTMVATSTTEAEYVVVASCCGQVKQSSMVSFGEMIHYHLTAGFAKTTHWNEFSSTMASAIICLAINQKLNFSEYIFDHMVKNLEGGVKFLMFPRFVQVFLDSHVEDMLKHKEIYVTPSHTKNIFANMERQGQEFSGSSTKVESSEDTGLGDQEDASKQGRMIVDLDADEGVALMLFNNTMKWIVSFVPMDTKLVKGNEKAVEGSSKRARGKLKQEDAKRQRIEEDNESVGLKRCLEIIPDDNDDMKIKATPLSFKTPTIVDYKIYKERRKIFFKIIRVDGNSQNYLTFGKMFKNFNIEDLEVLWSILKERIAGIKRLYDDLRVTATQIIAAGRVYADRHEIKDLSEKR